MSHSKFDPEKTEMRLVAIKYNGNVQAIARHYNINQDTIYKYFKRDPEGKKIIDDVRGLNTVTELDLAEHVMRFNMTNYKLNPGLAQRAAEKVIDKKGHSRGWSDNLSTATPALDGQVEAENEEMEEKAKLRKEIEELKQKYVYNKS